MIADPDKPIEYADVHCQRCGHVTKFTKSAIRTEIYRLRNVNFEILSCGNCQTKFSIHDLIDGLHEQPFVMKEMADALKQVSFIYESDPVKIEALEREKLEKEKQTKLIEDEKQKMQNGLPYDEKLIGPIEMEEGTPKDRNCVVVLKKEAEIYASVFVVLAAIGGILAAIVTTFVSIIGKLFDICWQFLKKINWCIACSIVRITYFVGYCGLVIWSIFLLAISGNPLITAPTLKSVGFSGETSTFVFNAIAWDIVILSIIAIPLAIQLLWASDGTSRWAKVIKKRMDEIIKR